MRSPSLLLAALSLAVSGCSTMDGNNNSAQPKLVKASLRVLMPGKPAEGPSDYQAVVGGGEKVPVYANPIGRNSIIDGNIATQCGVADPQKSNALPVLVGTGLTIVIGWVASYVVTEVSNALKAEILKFTGNTAGSLQFGPVNSTGRRHPYFYSAIPSSNGAPPILGWSCLMVQRLVDGEKGGPKVVASEAIIKVEVASSNDSLILRPLRFYFDQPVAQYEKEPSSKAKFGTTLGVTFTGLWQAESTGEAKSQQIFSAKILDQPIDIRNSGRPRFFYYDTNVPALETTDRLAGRPVAQQVALVPWSRYVTREQKGGSGTLTVTLTEVADVPRLLTFLSGAFSSNSKDVSDFLKSAAVSALGLDGDGK